LELRRLAIEQLNATVPGTELLLKASTRQEDRAALCEVIGENPQAILHATLAEHADRNGNALWSELLGTGPTLDRLSQGCLQWITGRTDLRTREEWQRWRKRNRPSPLAQRALVELVLEHPQALQCSAVLRRIIPSHLGAIPADCVPLYERMSRDGSPVSRYYGCYALLFYTDITDVVPIVIDLVDQDWPEDMRAGSCGPILLLRDRFAVNYFWDTEAWRDWWDTLNVELQNRAKPVLYR
jgi:hypothetical protein